MCFVSKRSGLLSRNGKRKQTNSDALFRLPLPEYRARNSRLVCQFLHSEWILRPIWVSAVTARRTHSRSSLWDLSSSSPLAQHLIRNHTSPLHYNSFHVQLVDGFYLFSMRFSLFAGRSEVQETRHRSIFCSRSRQNYQRLRFAHISAILL